MDAPKFGLLDPKTLLLLVVVVVVVIDPNKVVVLVAPIVEFPVVVVVVVGSLVPATSSLLGAGATSAGLGNENLVVVTLEEVEEYGVKWILAKTEPSVVIWAEEV